MLTVILIGGNSSRMGRDKALLPFEGGTFISSLTERYRTLGPVAVSVNRAGRFEHGEALELVDSFPGKGPINGLYSAFSRTGEQHVFLTATDIPFGDPSLALRLEADLRDYDACVIRRKSRYIEPLFGVYAKSCFKTAESFLSGGDRAMQSLLKNLNVRYIDEKLLGAWDLDRILTNVNSPEDYRRIIGN